MGYGTTWSKIDPDAVQPIVELRLRAEQVIHGRLLDPTGKPAQGARLWVRRLDWSLAAIRQATSLLQCGSSPAKARAWFVGPAGSPDVNRLPHLEILATSGPSGFSRVEAEVQQLAAAAYIPNVDRVHYAHGPFTDAEGRITLPCLIPGAHYRLSDASTMGTGKGAQVRKDFTVKPGETLELGDILIEKPRR